MPRADQAARVANLARLKKKILALAGPEQEALMLKANTANAQDMARLVRQIIPRGDERDGHLADTLTLQQLDATAVEVGIGNPAHP